MSGLGDQVVIRCSNCGYGLTARKYAVPKECPICRNALDPDAPPPEPRTEDAPQNGEPSYAKETELIEVEPVQQDAPQIQFDAGETRLDTAQAQAGDEVKESEDAHAQSVEIAQLEGDSEVTSQGEGEVKSLGETAAQPPSIPTLDVPPGATTARLGHVTQPIHDLDTKETSAESDDDETFQSRAVEASHTPRSGYETRAFTPPEQVKYETAPPAKFEISPSPTAGTPQPAASTQPTPAPQSVQPLQQQQKRTHAPGSLELRVSPEVVGRYADAYRVARTIVIIGTLIKVLGFLLGLVLSGGLIALGWWQSRQLGGNILSLGVLVGLFTGLAVFAFFFVLGTVVSAQGQLIKATLDNAVNSSPFLTNDQRAEAMSLR
jgi:hypothetical protein